MIIENEALYAALHQMHNTYSDFTKELVKEGYLTEGHANTEKSEVFINNFYESKKDIILKTIIEKNSKNTIFEDLCNAAKLTDYVALDAIIKRLEEEGMIKQIGIVNFDIL